MLKEITITNFKSINSEITFSMEADVDRVSEHKNHILHIGDQNILKISSMYGPNGGGKTNILAAILIVKTLILNENNHIMNPQEISCVFSDEKNVEETIFFVNEKYEIGYQFKIEPIISENNNINVLTGQPQKIYYLTYNIKEETVIYRKIGDNDFIELFNRDENGSVFSKQFSELGILDGLKLSTGKSVVNYIFSTFANTNVMLQECLDVINRLTNEIISINNLNVYNIQINDKIIDLINANKKRLISLLNDVDIKIKDIKLYKQNNYYPIFFEREINKDDKKIIKEISLSEESAGTQKIFWILVNVLTSIQFQKIYLCDDMNALLHPKLLRAVVSMFAAKENTNSQLIFNSHDIINMDSELFRRDEIWFVYRDENYSTQVIPLSNIVNYKGEQVRKDAKFSKQYLEGKYGADPFIKRGLNWNE